ncbi:MAG: sigma-70 family RNA polymerase sigma factor, partial [Planctomycetota bacterium]|nr:sigma-70 family RNA polymerase sigma factor [Planctomycetota bacterium]
MEGRDTAIPKLLEQHGGRLYGLGLKLCGGREEAEDLVQETFLQAYRKWDQFEGRAQPTTWLYTIASRICQRMHRRRAGQPEKMASLDELLPFGDRTMAVPPDGPLDAQIRKEGRARIESEIASLPDD